MLGTRNNFPGRIQESLRARGAGNRRRHGSLSSLPSSSISGRPIRDRRRIDERRKIKDIKVRILFNPIMQSDNNAQINHNRE